jgi:phage tail sheath protein FI
MSQINESAIKTPGVYVTEIPSFPPSIAQVATAIPAFIGYTETDVDPKGNSWHLKPKRITAMLDYQQYFGGAPDEANIAVTIVEHQSSGKLVSADVTAAFSAPPSTKYLMFYALQMYFMNGGGPCYIVSVDKYSTGSGSVDDTQLQKGLDAIEPVDEPTLIVFTDGQGVGSAAAYYTLQNNALALCAKLQDRFTLIDVYDNSNDTQTNADTFRGDPTPANGIGANNLNYGAAYYPNLVTTLSYVYDETAVPLTISVAGGGAAILASTDLDALSSENKIVHSQAINAIKLLGVQLPPSSTIAGVMAAVDATRGVWKAPANVGLNGVQALTDNITDESQQNLNIDATGKSINAIRAFTGRGILVWGARTLDGNSNDFRYVSVRRFYIMVEESVQKAAAAFVFEPNDGNTWVRVRAMIENYLTNLWRLGALAGSKPEQAFYVKVGLGQTMTFDDVLNGKMIVEIGMAPVRPAEFIILRFSQIQQQA